MKHIQKRNEPPSLSIWKRRNTNKKYEDLEQTDEGKQVRQDIRDYALKEQFYLCGYCCQGIKGISNCHNEHVESQNSNGNRTLDFSNIIASCNTQKQCGKAHKSRNLTLTPLMQECETELRFKISGRVEGLSHRAEDMIQILNLGDHEKNNRSLIERRKQAISALIWGHYGSDYHDLQVEDPEILRALIEELKDPKSSDGIKFKLEPFAPILVNLLKDWFS